MRAPAAGPNGAPPQRNQRRGGALGVHPRRERTPPHPREAPARMLTPPLSPSTSQAHEEERDDDDDDREAHEEERDAHDEEQRDGHDDHGDDWR